MTEKNWPLIASLTAGKLKTAVAENKRLIKENAALRKTNNAMRQELFGKPADLGEALAKEISNEQEIKG